MAGGVITGLCLALTSTVAYPEVDEGPAFDEGRVFRLLDRALGNFDELETLPERRWLRRDQESAHSDMNDLIDDAITILDVPELLSMRESYRGLESDILRERDRISELRERRVFAQVADPSMITRYTPTETLRGFTARTRGDYDMLIEAREANVQGYEAELEELKQSMSDALGKLNIDLPPDQLELWLSSAIGDDVISMSVVFQSIRDVTLRLEELTRESGENLTFARRYYGMVVILHKLVVRMQEGFIERVDREILPRLDKYRNEADEIIAESRKLLAQGGSRGHLENNIAANELTKRAINLYTRIVRSQRTKVNEALQVSKREENVAINTYRTVRLSSNVAELIRDGVNTFETLSSLQIPDTAEFQNNEIRDEFRKLTERMNEAL